SCFRLLFLAIIQTFFLISWFSLLLLQLLRHLFYRHLKLHRQRYILIVCRLMLVMVVFFFAFILTFLSTTLIMLFLLVLILLLMSTIDLLALLFALILLRFRLPSRLPMMFILWMVAMMVVIIPSSTVDRKSGSAGMPRPISYAVFCLEKKRAGRGRPALRRPGCGSPSRPSHKVRCSTC